MGFAIFLLLSNILVPAMMIAFGRVMWKHPPQKINGIYGYRTAMSMKNMDTWRFAHDYCGRLWWKLGWITLTPSLIASLACLRGSEAVVATVSMVLILAQCAVLIGSIRPTENALKRAFQPDGSRR